MSLERAVLYGEAGLGAVKYTALQFEEAHVEVEVDFLKVKIPLVMESKEVGVQLLYISTSQYIFHIEPQLIMARRDYVILFWIFP